jgi:hypothetical protein
MGTRINYEIGSLPSVILYSNSHHASEDPEAVFRTAVEQHGVGQTDLVRSLLNSFYKTASGHHRPGDYMFSVDLAPGEHDKVLRVDFEGDAPVIEEFSSDGSLESGVNGKIQALAKHLSKGVGHLGAGSGRAS